jgi:hypothetical protein
MTEREWLHGTKPNLILEFLGSRASERKILLLCSACSRHVWQLLESEKLRQAVEALECYVDNTIGREAFEKAASETHPLRNYRDQLFSGNVREELWLPAYAINMAMLFTHDLRLICRSLDFFAFAERAAHGETWTAEAAEVTKSPCAKWQQFGQAAQCRCTLRLRLRR